MCGISGVYSKDNIQEVDIRELTKMVKSLNHRGPDNNQIFSKKNIAFGHNRLKIIDLNDRSNQPMKFKNYIISFNGEIYNFQELKNKLIKKGHKFKTTGDGEVLLALYDFYGINFVSKIQGMFAIAIYDYNNENLLLIRDRIGIKPLYFYTGENNKIYFSSEIYPLTNVNNFSCKLNHQTVSEYLWYGNSFEERTIYKNINQVSPGTIKIFSRKRKVQTITYYRLEEKTNQLNNDKKFDMLELKKTFSNAVQSHMISDAPVSLMLSSGIDSSLIACNLSKSHNDLNTYSISFNNSRDESLDANSIASKFGLKNQILIFENEEILEAVQNLPKFFGEPFADAANIPLYLASKNMPQNEKVILQGDGGDEFFGGYDRYRYIKFLKFFNQGFMKSIEKSLPRKFVRYKRILSAFQNSDEMIMALLLTRETLNNSIENFLTPDYRHFLHKETDPFLVYKKSNERFKRFSLLKRMMLTDITTQLPSQFLPKVDRATMANSKEVRVPFLDHRLIEYALNIPIEENISLYSGKNTLRRLLKENCDKSSSTKRKKGFGVPYEFWLKTILKELALDTIESGDFIEKYNFSRYKLSELSNEFYKNGNGGFTLWKIFQLALWSKLS